MSADDDHRDLVAAHNAAEHFEAVHPGHLQIERHNIRAQLSNFLNAQQAVHGGSHHLNGWIALQHLWNQFPHQRGIVHHQNANRLPHVDTSRTRFRVRCETTDGTFRIKTTVPSPRIDAPLTRSDATRRSSNALMTSSSSPIKPSTISPNRRLPAPMVTTKCRVFCEVDVQAMSWSRRTTLRTWSRKRITSWPSIS